MNPAWIAARAEGTRRAHAYDRLESIMSKRSLAFVFLASTTALGWSLVVAAAVVRWVLHGPDPMAGVSWLEIALTMFGWALLVVSAGSLPLRVDRVAIARAAAVASALVALASFLLFTFSTVVSEETISLRPHFDPVQATCIAVPIVLGIVWQRRGAARLTAATHAAVGVLGVAMILTLARGCAPSPSHYLRSLDVSVPIIEKRAFAYDGRVFEVETDDQPALEPWRPWSNEPGSHQHGCFLRGPSGRIPLGNLWQDDECEIGWSALSTTEERAIPSAVYLDPSRRYAVLYQWEFTGPYMRHAFSNVRHMNPPKLCDGCGTSAMAIRLSDGKRVELSPGTIGWQLSVPFEMSGAASVGALLTLCYFVRAKKSGRRQELLAAFTLAIASAAPLVGAHFAGI